MHLGPGPVGISALLHHPFGYGYSDAAAEPFRIPRFYHLQGLQNRNYLKDDWEEHRTEIECGKLESDHVRIGQPLQENGEYHLPEKHQVGKEFLTNLRAT